MAKKERGTSAEKSDTQEATTRTSSADSEDRENRVIQLLIVAVILVAVGGYYVVTGSDPLELFTPPETPTPEAVGWWQVYFTDPHAINEPDDLSGSVPEKLIKHINNAQQTIHVAAFEFDLVPVAEALIAAEKRGVEVQWVTDDEHGIEAEEEEGRNLFRRLRRAGANVRDDDRGALMHNKFFIFDGQTVWTGSTNITTNGNFRNNNNVLVIESPKVAAIYEREFDEMWNGEFGPQSPSTADNQKVTIEGTPVQVLFAAEDEAISNLIPLVESAQSSIRFMAFSFTHDELGETVLARAKAGVDVKGIFEERGSETKSSEMSLLHCNGAAVRQDGNRGALHHKVFVIDNETVVTGSLNFSENADSSNDENVVIVTNPDIAARYLAEFELRWEEAYRPRTKDVTCE
jgi:phosphatidylserine/phosphatidylglycerophosphate/cardiolipin synthase-like enzyme